MLPRFPSLVFALVIILAVSPESHAGASNKNGNPFGNGTFFQNTGTFSAVIRGQNLSGTMLFSTGLGTNGGTTNSSGGSCVISYLGSPDGATAPGVYNGNSAGMWNPSSGSIAGQFWASYTLSGTNSATIWPEIYNTTNSGTDASGNQFSYYPYPINVISNVVIPPVPYTDSNGYTTYVPGTNYTITNTIYVEPMGSNTFKDSVMMNGSFDGSVQNQYPNQTFSAQGTIVQQQLYPQQQNDPNAPAGTVPVQMQAPLQIPVTVQGLRISDAYSSFATISNAIPYTYTTYTVTNIPSQQGGL